MEENKEMEFQLDEFKILLSEANSRADENEEIIREREKDIEKMREKLGKLEKGMYLCNSWIQTNPNLDWLHALLYFVFFQMKKIVGQRKKQLNSKLPLLVTKLKV